MKSVIAMEIEALRKRCVTPGSLADTYEVGQILGRGGFATVREGVHKLSRRHVALKILNPRAYLRDAVQTKIVLHEITILQLVNAIKNPNLLRFMAAHEDMAGTAGLPRLTIITDLCSGGELFDRIVARGHYSESDASQLVAKLGRALDDLHRANIIHRDIKPENILYLSKAEDSEPVIADFGLSKEVNAPETQTSLVGTPGYVSPEVIRDRKYTSACDVWALGVITYILLCGYPPFYAENNKELYAQICACAFEFHEDAWATISADAKDFITKMLEPDYHRRLTLREALAHPWIAKTQSGVHLDKAVANLREFNGRRKIKAAARAVVWGAAHVAMHRDLLHLLGGHAFTTEELSTLSAQFYHVSRSSSTVSLPQFREVMIGAGLGGLPLDRIFEVFDVDGSNDIDHREFMCGLARLRQGGNNEEALQTCFKVYDADNSGYITRDELRRLLETTGVDLVGGKLSPRTPDDPANSPGSGSSQSGAGHHFNFGASIDEVKLSKLEELFVRVDLNRDGKISFDEFKLAVHSDPLLVDALLNPIRRFSSHQALKSASTPTSSSHTVTTSEAKGGA